jgi:hypothetical protein
MAEKIKRSMAVRPSPIVMDGTRVRFPTDEERPVDHYGIRAEWHGFWGYRITRVTNSVDYRPGLALTKMDVQKLIADGWTVSVLSKG